MNQQIKMKKTSVWTSLGLVFLLVSCTHHPRLDPIGPDSNPSSTPTTAGTGSVTFTTTLTPTPVDTVQSTNTPTQTVVFTFTSTPTPTAIAFTNTQTETVVSTATSTSTATCTITRSATWTTTRTATCTFTPTIPTFTYTSTPIGIWYTSTMTFTNTFSFTPTVTDTPTITRTPTVCTYSGPLGTADSRVVTITGNGYMLLEQYYADYNTTLYEMSADLDLGTHFNLGVYDETSMALLGQTGVQTATATGWNTAPLQTWASITGGKFYWLGIWVDSTCYGTGYLYSLGHQLIGSTGSFPATFTGIIGGPAPFGPLCLYATGCLASGMTPIPTHTPTFSPTISYTPTMTSTWTLVPTATSTPIGTWYMTPTITPTYTITSTPTSTPT